MIDGGFDTSIPALSAFHPQGDDPLHTAHGSVVALLAKEVAPDCRLLLYTVTRDGRVDMDPVAHAIRRAVADGADVINLSLGSKVPVPDDVRLGTSLSHFLDWRSHLNLPPHPVSDAVREAEAAGVVAVAACGNKADSVLIPAADRAALAVGFLKVWELGDGELTGVGPDGYAQSRFADVKLVQPDGVLGSSFATPLVAGFAAISPHRHELRAYAAPVALAALASDMMIGWSGTSWDDAAGRIDGWFAEAIRSLPHHHRADDDPCPACGLLAVPGYLNWGLWKLRWGDLDGAEALFRVARGFAPSNAKLKHNLAVTLATRAQRAGEGVPDDARAALYAEAATLMGEAAEVTPGDPVISQKAAEYRHAAVAFRS